jgi:hypothetical protein
LHSRILDADGERPIHVFTGLTVPVVHMKRPGVRIERVYILAARHFHLCDPKRFRWLAEVIRVVEHQLTIRVVPACRLLQRTRFEVRERLGGFGATPRALQLLCERKEILGMGRRRVATLQQIGGFYVSLLRRADFGKIGEGVMVVGK